MGPMQAHGETEETIIPALPTLPTKAPMAAVVVAIQCLRNREMLDITSPVEEGP